MEKQELIKEAIAWEIASSEEDFTCWGCDEEPTCKYAWDLYNTNGDCLASK